MVLIAAVVPYNHGSTSAKLMILLAVVALGISLATPTNHFKNLLRDWMRRRFLHSAKMPAARPVEIAQS